MLNFRGKKFAAASESICLSFQVLSDLFIFILNIILHLFHPEVSVCVCVTYKCFQKEAENIRLPKKKEILTRYVN